MKHNIQLGDIVYHRSVYNHKEALKVVGIKEDQLLLEGDYSGGTNPTIESCWLPLKGTSRIYNHGYKELMRKNASNIQLLAIPCAGNKDLIFVALMDMVNAVLVLTSEVSLNPEF